MSLKSGSTKPKKNKIDKEKLLRGAELLLDAIEGSGRREGTKRTPERIARDWPELFEGYNYGAKDILNRTFSAEKFDEIIVVNTTFVSTCEHHLLPFWGRAWIGYLPRESIVGLDKIIKLVWMFSRRLQNQERITTQVADAIWDVIEPRGVMVILKATHGCISLRGTNANSETVTSAVRGVFKEKTDIRNEFLQLISLGGTR